MLLQLGDDVWTHLLEGLDLQRQSLTESNQHDDAKYVGEIIRTLQDLGKDRIGGTVDGYWFQTDIAGQRRRVEIRLTEQGR
jgi:hypothetical protein